MKKATIKAYEWAELSTSAKNTAIRIFAKIGPSNIVVRDYIYTFQGCPLIEPIEVRGWYEPEEGEKFARMCNITKEGMNKGWVWGNGGFYTKNLCDTISELRKDFPEKSDLIDSQLLQLAYDEGEIYYTEWEDENDFQYVFLDGELIEIKN